MSVKIIVMAKRPIPGHCKTRLAKVVGDGKAFAIYQLLYSYTEYILRRSKIPFLFHLDDEQVGENLGERMINAFNKYRESNEAVIFLGADFPFINLPILQQAIKVLEINDVVIGPAEDGGYYLIGLKKDPEKLFKNVAWSSRDVMQKTVENIGNGSFKLLPLHYDIDTAGDVTRFISENQNHMLTTQFRDIL